MVLRRLGVVLEAPPNLRIEQRFERQHWHVLIKFDLLLAPGLAARSGRHVRAAETAGALASLARPATLVGGRPRTLRTGAAPSGMLFRRRRILRTNAMATSAMAARALSGCPVLAQRGGDGTRQARQYRQVRAVMLATRQISSLSVVRILPKAATAGPLPERHVPALRRG
ncbi:hypothetical protein ACO0LM_01505, partial [Undibacterium sp. Di26W]|uniref:hypothetical protein n=1 Tax=Undibacterium sp. Di26W TaxID=3413035 RepID=UPI003BF2102A